MNSVLCGGEKSIYFAKQNEGERSPFGRRADKSMQIIDPLDITCDIKQLSVELVRRGEEHSTSESGLTLRSRKTLRAKVVDLSTSCAVPGCPLLTNLAPYWIALQILSRASALFRYRTTRPSSARVACSELIFLSSTRRRAQEFNSSENCRDSVSIRH
jgi:hypothetical protein